MSTLTTFAILQNNYFSPHRQFVLVSHPEVVVLVRRHHRRRHIVNEAGERPGHTAGLAIAILLLLLFVRRRQLVPDAAGGRGQLGEGGVRLAQGLTAVKGVRGGRADITRTLK